MVNMERIQERFFRYVACPSESGREREMCLLLEAELTDLGLPVRREDIGGEIPSNGWNIYTHLDGMGEPLLLSAHIDTVPPGENIRPVIKDGVIYSSGDSVLGADDKAGVAIIMEVLQTVIEQKLPHRTIEVLFAISEEIGLRGSSLADYSQIRSEQAIVLDSGTLGRIVVETPVLQLWSVAVLGKASHSGSHYDDGIHALKCAAEAVAKIGSGHVDDRTAINIANFLCKGKANVVPDKASFEIEIRCFDEELLKSHVTEIERTLQSVCTQYGASYEMLLLRQSPGMKFPPEHPLIDLIRRQQTALGVTPQVVRTYGGSDAVSLFNRGIAALNIGVGYAQAHSVHEHIALADLHIAAQLAERLVSVP